MSENSKHDNVAAGDAPFRLAFVAGVTPDKWLRIWGERSHIPVEARLVPDDDQVAVLHEGTADMCLLRLPVDRTGLHVIPLYTELPVVVVPKGHVVTALDEVSEDDLAGEPPVDLAAMTVRQAVEVVASGTGYVILPMSLARMHHRKDVESRPMSDRPGSQIGLAWLAENPDPRIERFIGIVRGRTERSSRDEPSPRNARAAKAAKAASTKAAQGAAGAAAATRGARTGGQKGSRDRRR